MRPRKKDGAHFCLRFVDAAVTGFNLNDSCPGICSAVALVLVTLLSWTVSKILIRDKQKIESWVFQASSLGLRVFWVQGSEV